MKRFAAITMTCIFALSTMSCPVLAESVSEDPGESVSEAVSEVVSDLPSDADDPADTNIQLTLSAAAGTLDATVLKMLRGTELRMLLSESADKNVLGVDLNALLCSNSIFRFLGSVDASDNSIRFSFPDVSGALYKAAFTVEDGKPSLDGLEDLLAADQVSVSYELDPELTRQALLPYIEMIGETISEQADTDTGLISLPYLGLQAEGETFSWAPDGDDAAELLDQIADRIETDDDLQALADQLADSYQDALNLMEEQLPDTGAAETSTEAATPAITQFSTDPSSYDPESLKVLIEYLRDLKTNAPKDLHAIADELPGNLPEGILTVNVSNTEDQVCRILLSAQNPSDGEILSADYEYLNNALSLYAEENRNGDVQSVQFACVRNVDGDNHTGRYQIRMNGERLAQGKYNFDFSRRSLLGAPYGELTLSTPAIDNAEITLGVRAGTQGGDDHYMTVGGIRPYITEAIVDDITIVLNSMTADQAAEAPTGDEVEIGDLSQEELEEVFTTLGDDILTHAESVLDRVAAQFR